MEKNTFLKSFMRWFFYQLYHSFAWTYEAVAWIVSAGRWNDWVSSALPLLEGPNVLELGHGPGRLQLGLAARGFTGFGLDESPQMGALATRLLTRSGASPRLVRADARRIPFPAGSFQSVVATFPSEYIFHPDTWSEIWRVLAPGGRVVVLAFVWITGRSLLDRALALLFRLTGQVPPAGPGFAPPVLPKEAGIQARLHWQETSNSRLLFLIAQKD